MLLTDARTIEETRREIYAIAYNFTKNYEDAMDLTQDVVIRLSKQPAETEFSKSYIRKVVQNMFLDHVRYRNRRIKAESLDKAIEEADQEPSYEDRGYMRSMDGMDANNALAGLLKVLTNADRHFILESFQCDHDVEHLSNAFKMPAQEVSRRIHTIIKTLRRAVRKPALSPLSKVLAA